MVVIPTSGHWVRLKLEDYEGKRIDEGQIEEMILAVGMPQILCSPEMRTDHALDMLREASRQKNILARLVLLVVERDAGKERA